MRPWILRALVLTAFALVVWLFGPKAYVALASRIDVDGARLVDLDRVGPHAAPEWLQRNPALYRAVLEELSPHLKHRVAVDDTAGLQAIAKDLHDLSWVKSVRLVPGEGGGLRLRLDLHRPVLRVVPIGTAATKVDPVFVTAEGICLRHGAWDLDSGLPACRLLEGPMPGRLPVYILGEEHPDPRVLAAAAVAVEWREGVAPKVARSLRLVEVDASNLHYRLLADRRTSQVRVVLRRADGGEARLDYGLPPNQPLPRVALADKVRVLSRLIERFPGLTGVRTADLRFVNTWERWVRTDDGSGSRAPSGSGR